MFFLSDVMLCVIILCISAEHFLCLVSLQCSYTECHNAERSFADWRFAVCHCSECFHADCCYTGCLYHESAEVMLKFVAVSVFMLLYAVFCS